MTKSRVTLALLVGVAALLLFQSCAHTSIDERPPAPSPLSLLNDKLFFAEGTSPSITPEPFLELTDRYREALDRLVGPIEGQRERYQALRRWMFANFEDYEFDVTETSSIGELATNRKINCLSFSAMFVAAARYMDIPANFQLVFSPPYWDTDNGTWINNQHINVTGVLPPYLDSKLESTSSGSIVRGADGRFDVIMWSSNVEIPFSRNTRYTMDISPAIIGPMRSQILNDREVLSLYYSNKAVEALLDQDLALAYAYTREALLTDSRSTVAWNNLGVLYSRVNALPEAGAAYEMAINLNDDAHSARSNLASVYRRMGHLEQAAQLEASVAEVVEENPYFHQALASDQLEQGNYEQAIVHLQDAVALKHNELLFYHELAMAHQQLGNREAVMANLFNARRHSRGAERARFSGKLRALRELYAVQTSP